MNKYPFKLKAIPREMIWGGNRLKTKFNKDADFEKLGESWELTVRPEAVSVIENGEYAGMALSEIIGCGYDFPLLIKFIDANDKLSVQVHPDDNIKDPNGTSLGKTEMWYIIDAEKDSHIIYGLCDGITKESFAEMVHSNNFEKALRSVPVKPGDCFFIPAGQVHAICEGILLAEIQQNSDTTYRIYDYGRLDKNGLPRQLHTSEALGVIRAYTDDDIEKIRFVGERTDNCLANCSKFKCFKHTINFESLAVIENSSFTALIFIDGNCEIRCNNECYFAKAGDTYYIPEELHIEISGDATFLVATP